MAETKWTKEQLNAIKTSGCNLLVAAAAGAGKTAVLVQRIIEKITNTEKPVDIDKLLIVTFTNAAASEMRERIGDAISKELEKNPSSRVLQRQLVLLNKASITTIHSFCLDVIRNNFHSIELDPGFRIADQTESTLLKGEALEELFEEKYTEDEVEESFLKLVDSYGGKRDDRELQEMVLRLFEFSRSMPDPEAWLIEAGERFNIDEKFDFGESMWADILKEDIKIQLDGILKNLKRAADLIKDDEFLAAYHPIYLNDINTVENLISLTDKNWEELYNGFISAAESFDTLPRCKKGADESLKKLVKDIRDECKKKIKKYRDDIFGIDVDSIGEDLKKLYPMMKSLAETVCEFSRKFSEKKRERGVIDFSDIEHFAIDILTTKNEDGDRVETDAAVKLREKYEEILIDEYQDSNMVQELILTTISRKDTENPNIFMVGDVKQSIYRFRQAKPELFLHKYNTYLKDEGKERKITLFKNFRSRVEVINAVNYIFREVMSEIVGELEYNDDEKLNPGAVYKELEGEGIVGGPVEVHIVESKLDDSYPSYQEEDEEAEDEETADEEELDSVQLEARVVARRIRELIGLGENGGFNVFDKNLNKYRPVEFRDIVILLRATQNWAEVFSEEMSLLGIPVYADTGTGYFKTIEVYTIMSLLQIIDNPMQDVPLLGVLRSPIFHFTPEDFIDIRLVDNERSFYEAVVKKAEDEDDVAEKCRGFINKLELWRKKSSVMAISEFIWYLYSTTGYYAYAAAMPGGIQRQANLRILFERAREFEETSYRGLFNFINFINRLKTSSGDMGSAKILGENENVVRIMSIHKSKGLEFPVVILSGCGKKFNLQDLNRSILYHQEYGFGPDFVDYERRIAYPTVLKQALKKKITLETLSEEMRILYVAFTRAKEKLIITGSVRNLEGSVGKWSSYTGDGDKIPSYNVLRGRTYLDWICPPLMKHPDGKALRDVIHDDFSPSMFLDDSKWEIKTYGRHNVITGEIKKGEEEKELLEDIININPDEASSSFKEEIQRRLQFKYECTLATKIPQVLSVTELKRRFIEASEGEGEEIFIPSIVKKPRFLTPEYKLSPAERGTIMHLVMQKLNLDSVKDEEEIKEQMAKLVVKDFISEEEAETVDIERIMSFFKSSIGERILNAKATVKREFPFNIFINSTDVYKELSDRKFIDEKIIVRGIIDCCFEEDGQLVIVDYKTDYFKEDMADEVRDKYSVQLEYYKTALEKMTGKHVKEKYLYMFHTGSIIQI